MKEILATAMHLAPHADFLQSKDVASRAGHLHIIHFRPHKLQCSKHSPTKMRQRAQLYFILFLRGYEAIVSPERAPAHLNIASRVMRTTFRSAIRYSICSSSEPESACRGEMQRVNRITTTAADKFQAARAQLIEHGCLYFSAHAASI